VTINPATAGTMNNVSVGASTAASGKFTTLETSDNVALFAAGSFGGGTDVVFIANASVVPGSNPTGGGILYVEGGALKFRGSGGTVTTIASS
jgi:hypothetical protein